MLAAIPLESGKEFEAMRFEKYFNVLVTEPRKAGDIIKAHIAETIVLPNVLEQKPYNLTGNDLLDSMAETLLHRKKISRALNRVNVRRRMQFDEDLIRVSKKSEKFVELLQGDDPMTFEFKDCYSHFGATYSEKFDSYSIGIRVPEGVFQSLRPLRKKPQRSWMDPPLGPSWIENERYRSKTLYLRLKPGQIKHEAQVKVSGKFTVSGIYLGRLPSLIARADEIAYKS